MYMTVDGDRGGFAVRNPLTGKKRRFAKEEEANARQSATDLAEWVEKERNARLMDMGMPTIAGVVQGWRREQLRFMPWSKGTAKNYAAQMNRIEREMGDEPIARTDAIFLNNWLTFAERPDTFNGWRDTFGIIWAFAISKGLAKENEGLKLIKRSTALILELNQKERHPLAIEGFKAIRAHAEPWLQLAMDGAILTLQRRNEIISMQHADFRDGFLFVICKKTSTRTDASFIKIKMTPDLEDLRNRALTLDKVESDYLIHRAPDRRYRKAAESKAHWTSISPDYLTKSFAAARKEAGDWEHLKPGERPSFNEIRGLGARTYKDLLGVEEGGIQILMAHADPKTTELYLQGGKKALKDENYVTVEAGLTLAQMLG
jgi:enterobacteria phage integrase